MPAGVRWPGSIPQAGLTALRHAPAYVRLIKDAFVFSLLFFRPWAEEARLRQRLEGRTGGKSAPLAGLTLAPFGSERRECSRGAAEAALGQQAQPVRWREQFGEHFGWWRAVEELAGGRLRRKRARSISSRVYFLSCLCCCWPRPWPARRPHSAQAPSPRVSQQLPLRLAAPRAPLSAIAARGARAVGRVPRRVSQRSGRRSRRWGAPVSRGAEVSPRRVRLLPEAQRQTAAGQARA